MTTTLVLDEENPRTFENPGAQLAQLREKKGYSREYVAGKLHLRVRVIELLETDNYPEMPEAVFIKGYFRAYAKLLEISPTPYIDMFNAAFVVEKKVEKALWQGKRESHHRERLLRWTTGLIVVAVVVGLSVWWQQNATLKSSLTSNHKDDKKEVSVIKPSEQNKATTLTDVSKLQSMFKASNLSTLPEKQGA